MRKGEGEKRERERDKSERERRGTERYTERTYIQKGLESCTCFL